MERSWIVLGQPGCNKNLGEVKCRVEGFPLKWMDGKYSGRYVNGFNVFFVYYSYMGVHVHIYIYIYVWIYLHGY